MSISQKIKQQISNYLSKSPSDDQLRKYLSMILWNQSPKQCLHHLELQQLKCKQPILVHVKLMVQDIRQNFYTYPFVIQRPFKSSSKIWNFKFGNQSSQFDVNSIQNPNYFSFLSDRQTIACTTVMYQTSWIKQIQKNTIKNDKIYEMITYELNLFKLGQVFSALCIYQPQTELLHYIRKAKQEQIQKFQNIHEYLNKPINPLQVRQRLLKKLQQVYSYKYSHFILYTMLSSEYLFISANQSNISLFKKILPRVCELKIRIPFKQSLFPYKKQLQNDQQIMIRSPMQMSNQTTFVVIDFSNFSTQSTVKIQNQQIDNLKALKLFVEDGKTIYRWLYGQSLLNHNHTGLIVKASNIINPQYIITQQSTQSIKIIPEFTSQQLRQYRSYVHQMRKLNPIIKINQKKLFEQKILLQAQQIKLDQLSLTKVMELSKLNAKSKGSQQIKIQDYQSSCKLFFLK